MMDERTTWGEKASSRGDGGLKGQRGKEGRESKEVSFRRSRSPSNRASIDISLLTGNPG